jgi:hypothetical protein
VRRYATPIQQTCIGKRINTGTHRGDSTSALRLREQKFLDE